jgi:hypothetical protein
VNGRGTILWLDRARIWNATEDFVASAEIHAPKGKVLVVKVIDERDHPWHTG